MGPAGARPSIGSSSSWATCAPRAGGRLAATTSWWPCRPGTRAGSRGRVTSNARTCGSGCVRWTCRAGRPRTLTGVALWGLRGSRPDWAALGAALATGLTIASYTVVDGLGARAAGSSLGYISWLMAVQGGVIPVYALTRRRGQFHLAI